MLNNIEYSFHNLANLNAAIITFQAFKTTIRSIKQTLQKFVRQGLSAISKRVFRSKAAPTPLRSTHCFRRCAIRFSRTLRYWPRYAPRWRGLRGDPHLMTAPTPPSKAHPTLDRELCTQIRCAAPPPTNASKINLLPANIANWPPWLAVSRSPRALDRRSPNFRLGSSSFKHSNIVCNFVRKSFSRMLGYRQNTWNDRLRI